MKIVALAVIAAVVVSGCASASTAVSSQEPASGASTGSSQQPTAKTPVTPSQGQGAGDAATQGCALESDVTPEVWVLFTVSGENANAACAQAVADSGSWPPDGGDDTFTPASRADVSGAERQSPVDCTIYTPPITTGNGIYLPPSSTGLTFEFYGSSSAGTQAVCFGVAATIPGARSTDS